MADIILRVSGPGLAPADALSLVERARIIRFVRVGERAGLHRRLSEHPSFNLQIAENDDDPGSAIAEARAFVGARMAELVALADRGAHGELDFGIHVSGMRSTRLEPEFLELLVRARLTLCVTSYADCEEDDETSEEDWKTVQKPPG